ncbi:MAG TPA: TetR/AcrR family transcriptional regulator, partial [Acidobacteriota bacterium]|nr:TetR/AcrR family transcriptional regulator [Acidobacteriota bacterium]
VNLAALNYHFGSKDALVDAVFERRVGPLNRERLRLLEEAETHSGQEGPSLEEVLRAFLAPAIRLASDPESGGGRFMKLMGRAHSETGDFFSKIIARQFAEVFQRFTRAFRNVLPDLPPEEHFWRIHFVIGAMAHTMAHSATLRYLETLQAEGVTGVEGLSLDKVTLNETDAVLSRLVRFAVAGLQAEVPVPEEVGSR